jgi:hypothetical protein
VSARHRAMIASALIIAASLGAWFAVLATFNTTEQRDCPVVNPPAAVPGPPVKAGR